MRESGVGVSERGYPSRDELQRSPGYPSRERMQRGPVAVIECVQEIPCNPCEAACPHEAITIGHPITNRPSLDEDRCIGCGVCIPQCPGLAIFVVNLSYSDDCALVSFPHEYAGVPQVGEQVEVVDRSGLVICTGETSQVLTTQASDRTAVVTVEVPRKYAVDARGIRRVGGTNG